MWFPVLYALFCIFLAFGNAWLTKNWVDWSKGRKIPHGVNGAVHLIAYAGAYILNTNGSSFEIFGLPIFVSGLLVMVATVFTTRLVFDVAFNLFIDQAWDYVTETPKALWDKVEQAIFNKNGRLPKYIYSVLIITLTILSCVL